MERLYIWDDLILANGKAVQMRWLLRLYRWDNFKLANGKTVLMRWLLIRQWKDCTDEISSNWPMERMFKWDDF